MRAALIIILGIQCFSSMAHAFYTDLNFIYFSDSFTTPSPQANTRMLYDVALGIDIDSKGRFTVGWNVTSLSTSDQMGGGTATTFSTFDMGPRFGYFISKDKTWSLDVAYLLIGTGVYKGTGAEEKLRGATIKAALGYMPQISDAVSFGIKLNYYAPSFTESLDSAGTVITKVSYARSFMFPSLALSYRF